jgi:tetratricopeptide (TPR) repeat protein
MKRPILALALVGLVAAASPALAQAPRLTMPDPSPAASVSQRVGVTDVTVSYHRPAVKGRTIWGDLVPYEQVWRAGANENTVLTLSSPATVGGQRVPAGTYGVHMIPTAGEWTVILSNESTAWGSFFYDEAKDAARLRVTPRPDEFVERLTYTFDDPTEEDVTLTLRWEKLAVPISIAVDTPTLVTESLRRELHGLGAFFWQTHAQAATWSAQHDVNLDEAEAWAERAVTMNPSFQTLRAKALVLEKKGDAATATALREQAMARATEADINGYGYQLLQAGDVDKAIEVFRKNVADHPDSWNTYDSLGEALAVKGETAESVAQYRKALSMVKDDQNRKRIDAILTKLGSTD